MKDSVVKALIIIVTIGSILSIIFIGLPWAVQTSFSTFGVSVSYKQAIALISLTALILEALKD